MIDSAALATLLDARTVRVFGTASEARRLAVSVRAPASRTRKNTSDVALLAARAPKTIAARAVLAPCSSRKLGLEQQALLLGRGSALWSPGLVVGLADPAVSPRYEGDEPALVITQGRQIASHILQSAARHRLPLRGVICTGADQPTSWSDLLQAAWQLDVPVLPLVALHRPASPEQLATTFERAARVGGIALLLPAGAAAATVPSSHSAPGPFQPSLGELATAAGWPTVASVEQLVIGALLHRAGLRKKTGVVRCRDVEADERALIERVVPNEMLARSKRARVDCTLQLGAEASLEVEITATSTAIAPSVPLEVTAAALTASLRPLLPANNAETRPARASAEDTARSTLANILLDHWENSIDQPKCTQLLGCFDIEAVAGELVRSPSAAAEAAGRVGLPVSLCATGPSLAEEQVVAGDIPTASAARRAFRELLDRCSSLDPTPVVDGVLVRPDRSWPLLLQVIILFPRQSPPLVRLGRQHGSGLALPASVLIDRAEHVASALLGKRPRAAVKRLAQLLRRTATLADLLADRMTWLRLDIGVDDQPDSNPLVYRCSGWQRLRLNGLIRP